MLSKNQIREIRSLQDKKNRLVSGLFIAEGKKLICELLNSDIEIETIFTTKEYLKQFLSFEITCSIVEVSEAEIGKISQLITSQGCLALCKIPQYNLPHRPSQDNFAFCLDGIQDPGNLGTLVRLSDWFGMKDVFCSPPTADIYNPKVVQATMGAISRVRVHYTNLEQYLENNNELQLPVLGTYLDGEDLYKSLLPSNGLIILGNEGKGISNDLAPFINKRITIPDFHTGPKKPESLNVSVAAAVIISELKRRSLAE